MGWGFRPLALPPQSNPENFMLIQSKLRPVEQFIQNCLKFQKNRPKKHFLQIDPKGIKMTYVDFQNYPDKFL